MASHLPMEILSHKRKVCSLYKRIARNLEAWYYDRLRLRLELTMLRAKFDENKNCTDPETVQSLMADAEKQLFLKQHYQPKKWPKTIGGNAYGRETVTPDWVLDYWHPLEKAQYPNYFATREKRKLEFIKMWEEEYGKPSKSDHHH